MFTGIIETTGSIRKIKKNDSGIFLEILISSKYKEQYKNNSNIGDSIAINGTCLTLVEKNDVDSKLCLSFDVVKETLSKTNLGQLNQLDIVNLETPLKIGDGLDGHIVQGHIDTVGSIAYNSMYNNNWKLEVLIDKKWLKYCINKGSIAIDGISLTIASINDNVDSSKGSFSLAIIPHTLEKTNLKFKKIMDTVNIEFDFFGKYIERLLEPRLD